MTRPNKIAVGVAIYFFANSCALAHELVKVQKENRKLKKRSSDLTKLTNSMISHTRCTPEEIQLAIDINFEGIIRHIDQM